MSFANQFGKLFNRKPAPAEAEAGAEGNSDLLSAESPDAGTSRDPYQVEPMNSVQGDVDSYAPGSDDTVGVDSELITLPVLGSATAAAHQRRLLALLAVGVVALGVIAAWVLRQADQSAQQLAATGQSLMQSQRLAKSVSQALVGSPQAFPEVVESSGVLARNIRALSSGDAELGVPALGEPLPPHPA